MKITKQKFIELNPNLSNTAGMLEPFDLFFKCIVGVTIDGSHIIYNFHDVVTVIQKEAQCTKDEAIMLIQRDLFSKVPDSCIPIFIREPY